MIFDYELQKFYRSHAIDNHSDSLFVDTKYVPRNGKRYVQLIGDPPQEIIQKFLLPSDVLISGELCSELYCDDPVFGPQISKSVKDETAEAQRVANRLISPLGLVVGQKYSIARKILLSLRWKPFVEQGDDEVFHYSKKYFEVVNNGGNNGDYWGSWKSGTRTLIIYLTANDGQDIIVDATDGSH